MNRAPQAVADWMAAEKRLLMTDTTMRDAHQSLLATRMRSIDMIRVAPAYAHTLPQSVQRGMLGWGHVRCGLSLLAGMPVATPARPARGHAQHDDPNAAARVQWRGLYELPRQRGAVLSCKQAAETGVDVFRVFDSLNWVENMRVAMDAVIEANKICEGTICYTGDILEPRPREI
jgi:pyruvate carboxylase